MTELMPEERDWLVRYCRESEENARLALKIGQIQLDLREAIIRSFLEELDVKCSLDLQWKAGQVDKSKWGHGNWALGLPMTMEEMIRFSLVYDDNERTWSIVAPADCEACPEADRVAPHFEDTGVRLRPPNQTYHWWFYAEEDHKFLKDPAMLLNEDFKREKIEYFTHLLLHTAKAISTALEE